MKFKAIRKLTLIAAVAAISTVICGISASAFVEGYENATELTSSVTASITRDGQNDWYQFTLTADQVPTPYSLTLKIPTGCVYNFDLRYREADSEERPTVVSNETFVTGTRNRIMYGVITQPGTYFVRIYSQDGNYSGIDTYKITKNINRTTPVTLSFGNNLPETTDRVDWAVCADILGNFTYNRRFKNSSTGRNYKNAYVFIHSNQTSDDVSEYDARQKANPTQLAKAADYIYAGDVLTNPKFEVETNKIYTIEELARFVYEYNQPVVFYVDCEGQGASYRRYVILEAVSVGRNTIKYYTPDTGSRVTVNYDDFLQNGFLFDDGDGIEYRSTYKGTNILERSYRTAIQPVYN